jgi:hypothetical protein
MEIGEFSFNLTADSIQLITQRFNVLAPELSQIYSKSTNRELDRN